MTHVDEGETEVNPVRNNGTDSDGRGLDTDQESSVVRLGTLGDPRRESGRVGTVTETGNDTTDDELNESSDVSSRLSGTEGRDSDDGTDDHDNSSELGHLPSTELLSDEEREHGTEETTDLSVSSVRRGCLVPAHLVTSSNRSSNGTGVDIVAAVARLLGLHNQLRFSGGS